ncbi:MAG: PD40 domain-containing protein, partial [Planctomycetes bacterium]|nr:PD40 domain-containing protein [Planctomycetota bacterium]
MKKTILLVLILALGMVPEVVNADFTFGTPTNLGPPVNSAIGELGSSITADGLQLYFLDYPSRRPGGYGNKDIWVTTRSTKGDPWGEPVNLGPIVNSSHGEDGPSISADGLMLYFSSNRPGGQGGYDIWVTTRETRGEDWGHPVNLGPPVNTSSFELGICISPDGLQLYFDDYFGPRPGGQGRGDLWVTTRATVSDPWGVPVNLGPTVNGSSNDICPNVSADGRTAVLAYLERAGIPHRERNGRLMVPAEREYTVLKQLTTSDVISSSDVDFSAIITDTNPFLTKEQNRKRWLITKMNVLSMLIGQFSGIERATVVIDQPDFRGFGSSHLTPTASVTVFPRGEGLSTRTIEAIADLVAGAQPGLKVSDVRVIDAKNGTSYTPRDEQNLTASRYLEVKQATERDVRATIEDLLAPIAGVRVAVNAQVDVREVEQRLDRYEDPKVGPLSQSRRTLESTSQSTSAEPGVRPNTGAAIAARGASGTQVTDESSRETTLPVFPRDARLITDPKGYALKINATILVPRSYFVARFRMDRNDPEAVPDEAQLEPVVTSETARIKAMVEPLIDTAAYPEAQPGTVVVSMIPDMVTAGGVAMPGVPAPGMTGPPGALVAGGMNTDLLKYILLAG